MSPQLITVIVYVLLFLGTLVLYHFGFVPAEAVTIVIALIGGHAAGTTTLIPSTPEQSPNIKEVPSVLTGRRKDGTFQPYPTSQSLPDVTTFPTVMMPVVKVPQKTIDVADPGPRG